MTPEDEAKFAAAMFEAADPAVVARYAAMTRAEHEAEVARLLAGSDHAAGKIAAATAELLGDPDPEVYPLIQILAATSQMMLARAAVHAILSRP